MISRTVLGPTRVPRSSWGRRLAFLATASLALYALMGGAGVSIAGEKAEIIICHGTGSGSNPYVVNSPAVDSSGATEGVLTGGHSNETAPIRVIRQPFYCG